MSKLNYLLTCESAITGENNAYTLVNIFNILRAEKFPFKPDRFTIAFSVDIDKKTLDRGVANVRISVVGDDEKAIAVLEGKAHRKEKAEDGILRSEVDFAKIVGDLVFPKPGVYHVLLSLDKKVIGSKEINVIKTSKKANS